MAGHILIVDDDPDICEVLRDRLESYGYRVEVAADGDAALLSIKRSVPQGLLLDLNIPRLHGHEVLRVIRWRHPLLPVIIMTADISPKQINGASAVVFKPIDALKLKALVGR